MAKNLFGKRRDLNKPYAEYQAGNITYRILKTYKMASNETSHYDIWYTAAKSPMTYDQWEYGDMYKNDIHVHYDFCYIQNIIINIKINNH